jgi:phage recombination protein Bet
MKRRARPHKAVHGAHKPVAAGIVERAIERSMMSRDAFTTALHQTAFQGLKVWSQTDLERLLVTAERYGLNPLNREIFALGAGHDPMEPILLVVGVDGWSKILNSHPEFDGMSFVESQTCIDDVPQWIECTIHRKDRAVAISVKEFFQEVRGEHMAWLTHPRRMLRHKALVQCARLSFALSGIYDPDEAKRVQSTKQYQFKTKAKPSLKECLLTPILSESANG